MRKQQNQKICFFFSSDSGEVEEEEKEENKNGSKIEKQVASRLSELLEPSLLYKGIND